MRLLNVSGQMMHGIFGLVLGIKTMRFPLDDETHM
jgi:hypothetical protein